MELPKAKTVISLTSSMQIEEADVEMDFDMGVTDVTILAVDHDEAIWTVWDHTDQCIKLVYFDENCNWRWLDVKPNIEESY